MTRRTRGAGCWLNLAAACGVALLAGCGGDSSPATPSPPPGGGGSTPDPVTITITADGVTPKTVRIEPGQRVRFVNNSTTTVLPTSDPHPIHTDCPGINAAGTLAPGQAGTTAALVAVRACGYHDHDNPDDGRFRGQIVVGTAQEMPGY
ncbi:MAG TPA: hypothetical protein VK911_08575 [Vicinamibacterales bacterium]|nr:hypothetical protein [Vicinamibacterales bacterium]